MTQILEAFVGLQWGDEGKGKLVDEAATLAHSLHNGDVVVVRYQGGANAGHSTYVRDSAGNQVKFVTHAAPSGLMNNSDVAIGPQVAFDPIAFLKELREAERLFGYYGRVMISERVGVVLDYHKQIDAWRERFGENGGIGSTKQGIGPFYEDNAARTRRITFADYTSDRFPDKLRLVLEQKKREMNEELVEEIGMNSPYYLEKILEEHATARVALAPFVERLEYRLRDYLENGNHIIIEGGQGSGLDVDMGTIPDQTSSHLLAPHAFPGLGLPRKVFKIHGVEKLYPTRVGSGHMPTLADNEFGRETADNAGEVGATTGRKRRVGYPDWVFVKRSVILNDCDGIFLTRADNVQDRDLKVCLGYRLPSGQETQEVPLNLEGVTPIYSANKYNWHLWDGPQNLSKPMEVDALLRVYRERYVSGRIWGLPESLQNYIVNHDNFVGVRTVGISIGPGRGETVIT